jgi:hypothetical protein
MIRTLNFAPVQVPSRTRSRTGLVTRLAKANSPIGPMISGEFARTEPQPCNVSQTLDRINLKHVRTRTASSANIGSAIKGTP